MKNLLLMIIGMMLITSYAEELKCCAKIESNTAVCTKTACTKSMASNEKKQYKKEEILTLVSIGVDQKTVTDAEQWIEKNIYPPIDVQVKSLEYNKSFSDQKVLVKELEKIKKDNLAIVALVKQTPAGVSISNSVNVIGNTGIVYVGPYMTKYAKEHPELELYKWRVNKEALKGAALAMGMKRCPFPRCCLSPDYDDARIDEKGRNLCPPCWKKMYELMTSKGIKEPVPPHLKKAIAK